jgi:hypothetical protein
MPDDLRIYRVGITPAEREVIDGVEQVGLPHPVVSHEAVNAWGEAELSLLDILVVQYG